MSYNDDVKTYLSKISEDNHTVAEIELYGLLHGGLIFILKGRGAMQLRFETENAALARKYYTLVKRLFSVSATIRQVIRNRFGEKHIYVADITETSDCLEILRYYDMIDVSSYEISRKIDSSMIRTDDDKRAYLRGIFLSAGYIADPKKNYLIEFRSDNQDLLRSLQAMLSEYEIISKMRLKKNEGLLYIKRSEDISMILALCGAYDFMLNMQDKMAMKDMRNKLQRLVNCDTANVSKTIEVSLRQQKAIDKISKSIGLQSLPESLIEAAQLRIDNPESSLSEMAANAVPPLSRSTLNKRLTKIIQIADAL